jgi:hypothetical protein
MEQFIRTPLMGEIKAIRGIGEFASPELYSIVAVMMQASIPVEPGKETPVPVTVSALPPNADIERVVATLHIGDATGTPSQTTTGISVVKNNDPGNAASGNFAVAVDQPQRPSNVQLKLAGGETFWSMGGVLAEWSYDLPDFAAALNTYLDTARAPITQLPFVLTSATAGKVGLSITALDYAQVKTQSWPNELDGTTRVDRNLDLGFGATERILLDPLTGETGRTVALQRLQLDISGQLGPERLLGAAQPHDGTQWATISSEYALAQQFSVSGTLIKNVCRCAGIASLLAADDRAEVYAELQADAGGAPATGAPLAQATVALDPATAGTTPWIFAQFAAPAELKTDTPYWIVLKGVRGTARIGVQTAANEVPDNTPVLRGALRFNRGGQTWKTLTRSDPALWASCGLVYLPGPDDQTAAVEVVAGDALGSGTLPPTRIDPTEEATTIALIGADGTAVNWNTVALDLRSHARGTLSIANVIEVYKVT